jgi:hypothetical protein
VKPLGSKRAESAQAAAGFSPVVDGARRGGDRDQRRSSSGTARHDEVHFPSRRVADGAEASEDERRADRRGVSRVGAPSASCHSIEAP